VELITTCIKRKNEVNILVHTNSKKVVESLYVAPDHKLLRRLYFHGTTVEEIRHIYLTRLEQRKEMGYEIKDQKEGKIIPFYTKM
jgi:hypothetical protein